MNCNCGQQLKVVTYEDGQKGMFCPKCLPNQILKSLTGLEMEDFDPDPEEDEAEEEESSETSDQENEVIFGEDD